MNKLLILIIIATIVLVPTLNMGADMISSSSVFTNLKENIAKEGTATFTISNPESLALPENSLIVNFREDCGSVESYEITQPSTCTKQEPIYTTKETCEIINNKTTGKDENICNQEQIIESYKTTTYDCEKKIEYIDGIKDYRIKADITPSKCLDGTFGYKIDWIPSLNTNTKGIITKAEWAWWNITYSNRQNITNSGTGTNNSYTINGTAGWNGLNIYYTPDKTGTTSIYYANTTAYAIIKNDTTPTNFLTSTGGINNTAENIVGINDAFFTFDTNGIAHTDISANHYNITTNTSTWTNTANTSVYGGAVNLDAGTKILMKENTSFYGNSINFWTKVKTDITSSSTIKTIFAEEINTAGNPQMTLLTGGWTGGCTNEILSIGSIWEDKSLCISTAQIPVITAGWHMITLRYDGNSWDIYYDGNNMTTTCGSTCFTKPSRHSQYIMGWIKAWEAGNRYDGIFDNLLITERNLTSTEIMEQYNNGLGTHNSSVGSGSTTLDVIETTSETPTAVNQQIIFVSQSPDDITSTNIFGTRLNITYNITGNYTANATNPYLNYTITDARIYTNGSLTAQGYRQEVSQNNSNLYSYLLADNNIYPATYNINETYMENTAHSNITIDNNPVYFSTEILNLSLNTTYNMLEAQFKVDTTSIANIYYCNSSYDFTYDPGSPACTIIAQETRTTYNHTHNQSQHNLYNLPLNSTGYIGTIKATSKSYIIMERILGNAFIGVIADTSRTGLAKTGNPGGIWTNRTYTPDLHIHQFYGTENLLYQACMMNSTAQLSCSSFRNDSINLTRIPPTPPIITSPASESNNTRYLNFTWTNSTPNLPSTSIKGYNISIINSDLTYNMSLINTTGLSNNYDTYNQNFTTGNYYFRINSTDTLEQTSNSITNFNITRNSQLNITAINTLTGATITSFNINITDIATGIEEDYASSNNKTSIEIIKGHNYNITIDATGYALDNKTYNASNNETYQQTNFSLYTTNSVYIYIYDESTLELINGTTISLTFTDNTTATTASTNNGTYFKDGLSDGTWQIKFYSTIYAYRTYTISVANRSTQTLNAYLANSNYTAIFTISNCLTTGAVQGANFIMQRLANSSYIITENKLSDITGRVQVGYIGATEYQFILSKTGFTTKTFTLDPIIFNSYTICLDPTTEQDSTYDYEQLSIIYYPKTFINNQVNNFHYTISSPTGSLTNYSVRLIAPGDNQYETGALANGQTYIMPLNITGASYFDRVNLTYTYTTTTGGTHTFRYALEIINTGEANGTIVQIKTRDYGLGLFETGLLATLAIVVAVGLSYALVGMGGALILGLLMQGIAVYLGFLPLASILISVFVGILLLIAVSTKN